MKKKSKRGAARHSLGNETPLTPGTTKDWSTFRTYDGTNNGWQHISATMMLRKYGCLHSRAHWSGMITWDSKLNPRLNANLSKKYFVNPPRTHHFHDSGARRSRSLGGESIEFCSFQCCSNLCESLARYCKRRLRWRGVSRDYANQILKALEAKKKGTWQSQCLTRDRENL
jgi:hypothetical protein